MCVCVALAAETSHFLALFPLSFTPPSLSSGCNDELILSAWTQSELIAELLIHLSSAWQEMQVNPSISNTQAITVLEPSRSPPAFLFFSKRIRVPSSTVWSGKRLTLFQDALGCWSGTEHPCTWFDTLLNNHQFRHSRVRLLVLYLLRTRTVNPLDQHKYFWLFLKKQVFKVDAQHNGFKSL